MKLIKDVFPPPKKILGVVVISALTATLVVPIVAPIIGRIKGKVTGSAAAA
jgi:hypothetical protein